MACGYLSGHLSVHHWRENQSFRVALHARSISGIDVDPERNWVITCSEDTFVNVLAMPEQPGQDVKSLWCQSVSPSLLTGIQFIGENRDHIFVSSYDSSDIICITL